MSILLADFAYLQRLLHERSGMALGDDKEYLLDARLQPLIEEHGVGGIAELVAELKADPKSDLCEAVVEAMAIHESYFFREKRTFDVLQRHVLPYLIERRQTSRSLRIWSAACAKGQEPYSLAMLLLEHFPQLVNWSLTVFASDFSRRILEQAQAGEYGQHEVNRGLPARLIPRYFERQGLDWRVNAEPRRLVEFERINLLDPLPAHWPRMELIVLGNALIYFDPESRKRALASARETLKPDGLLVLGAAETSLCKGQGFRRVPLDGFMACFQRDDATGGPGESV